MTNVATNLSELDIYRKLLPDCLTCQELRQHNFPRNDSLNPTLRLPIINNRKIPLSDKFSDSYTCERCSKQFSVRENGRPKEIELCNLPDHLGRRSRKGNCTHCNRKWSAQGCNFNLYHVHRGDNLLANYTGYVATQPRASGEKDKLLICALGCETAWTTYGLELIRVTVVNYLGHVLYDQLVKPKNRVLEYNTELNGIIPDDIKSAGTSLRKVQRKLLGLISNTTIVIGHDLEDTMKVLKIFHKSLVDTSLLYKEENEQKQSLEVLMFDVLGVHIQPKPERDSIEDARASLRLAIEGS